jgi:hypothetical protein
MKNGKLTTDNEKPEAQTSQAIAAFRSSQLSVCHCRFGIFHGSPRWVPRGLPCFAYHTCGSGCNTTPRRAPSCAPGRPDRVGGSLAAPTSHTTVRAVRHTAVHGRRCKRGARSWRGVLRCRRGRLTRPHRTLAGSARYPPGGLRHRSRPVGVSIGRRGVGPCRSSRFGPSPQCAAATVASADFWPPFAAPHGATSRNGGRPDLPG